MTWTTYSYSLLSCLITSDLFSPELIKIQVFYYNYWKLPWFTGDGGLLDFYPKYTSIELFKKICL